MDFMCACLKPRNATRGREGSLGGHCDTRSGAEGRFPRPPATCVPPLQQIPTQRSPRTPQSHPAQQRHGETHSWLPGLCHRQRGLWRSPGPLLWCSAITQPLQAPAKPRPGARFCIKRSCVCLKTVPRCSLGAAITVCSPHKAPLTLACCPSETSSQQLRSDISTLSLTLECKHAAAEEKQRCSELTQPGALGEDSCAVSVTGITRALPTA